ncbi:iron uptake transporter permease EfeU [Nakamurella sp.]|uniref:iron uptake transporter permease EfeU n=1 Tax=Nakamurella sp. TaxID=1869182 RepID=UPI0037845462
MLATFVIGLREGLEAALIVGIIAAFLKQSNRADALRHVWIGVGVAVAICLGVGVLLQVLRSELPQQQQEMLECVVAGIAVLMISYMILWMRKHSRDLRSSLQNAAGSALARGSAAALIVMAFLAVIREGFETSVFLLAAFQSAVSPLEAAIGVVLGIAVAVGLGYLVYRGGIKLNLSRFFRITGAVLVLVAAGLVMSTLRAAYEAGWLTMGQQQALDLTAIARPGSVQESLLTGMLGIRSTLPVVEVVAYVLYAVPMLLVVLWPPKHTPSTRTIGRILVGSAAAAIVVAGGLVALAPAVPAPITTVQGPFALAGEGGVTGTATIQLTGDVSSATLSVEAGGATTAGTTALTTSGHIAVATTDGATATATTLTGTPISAPAQGDLPATLTAQQIAALNGGRLPVGIRSVPGQTYPAVYTDTVTPTVTADQDAGIVVGLSVRLVRTAQVEVVGRAPVQVGTALETTLVTPAEVVAPALARVAEFESDRDSQQVLGRVIPGLLVVFAVVMAAFGLPKLRRRSTAASSPPTPPAGRPPQAPPVAAAAPPDAESVPLAAESVPLAGSVPPPGS